MSVGGEQPPPLPACYLIAYLEERGYRHDQILKLTRIYINRVLGWPRDQKGRLTDPRRKDTYESQMSIEESMRHKFWCLGYPEHLLDRKVKELLDSIQQPNADRHTDSSTEE